MGIVNSPVVPGLLPGTGKRILDSKDDIAKVIYFFDKLHSPKYHSLRKLLKISKDGLMYFKDFAPRNVTTLPTLQM